MTWGYAQPAPFHKHVIPLDRGATSLANQVTLSSTVVVLVKWSWHGAKPHVMNVNFNVRYLEQWTCSSSNFSKISYLVGPNKSSTMGM